MIDKHSINTTASDDLDLVVIDNLNHVEFFEKLKGNIEKIKDKKYQMIEYSRVIKSKVALIMNVEVKGGLSVDIVHVNANEKLNVLCLDEVSADD
jgi:hypothetical protein